MIGGRKSLGFLATILTMLWIGQAYLAAVPMGTAFTYQGRFYDGNSPASDVYDFQFTLYDAATAGSQVGNTVNQENIDVNDGYFTTTLDFGSGVFTGNARWLQIAVRPGTQTGSYTTLNPRHELTPVPYAINAATSGTADRIAKFIDGGGLADSVMRESNGGIGIGTATQHSNIQLDILGTNTADHAWPNLLIRTSNPPTAGAGGHITFGGKWQDTGDPVDDYTQWAGISGRKENGTSGEYGGYFTITTREHGSGGVAERLRITSTGDVGIGTTAPSQKLHVSGGATAVRIDSAAVPFVIQETDQTLPSGLWRIVTDGGGFRVDRNTSVTGDFASFQTCFMVTGDGTTVFGDGYIGMGTCWPTEKLDVNGNVRCVDLVETSDEQLKADIQTLGGVLDRLNRVRAVSFRWNEKAKSIGAKAGAQQIGVLAQELEQVFPELVTTPEPVTLEKLLQEYPEEMRTEELRQRLERDAERTNYKAVSYSKLTAVLLQAVKELQAENQSLEQRIQALESKAQ